MFGPDVFAVLTPGQKPHLATSAFRLSHNSEWFCGAAGGVATKELISSREATPAYVAPQGSNAAQDKGDCLVLTFDKLLRLENLQNGIQFGTRQASSHILLGHRGTTGISARQYSIIVDDNLEVWLQDNDSAFGTAVGHDGQNEDKIRKNERWLLAYEPGVLFPFEGISIQAGAVNIRIQFPNQMRAGPRYVRNLQAFVKKCTESKSRVPTTRAPTGVRTPGQEPLYFKDALLGAGTYGKVYRVIKLRDGRVFASKTFQPPRGSNSKNKRERDRASEEWWQKIRQEYAHMRNSLHPNVIEVFSLHEEDDPRIIMPYFSDGNIAELGDCLGTNEYITALGQVLDGLIHLHAKKLVHRDLKPENLLVERKPHFKVVIADFGLASVVTDTTLLLTFCGTTTYMAPEVFTGFGEGYGALADIWSLGVIALGWLYDFPDGDDEPKRDHGRTRAISSWGLTWTSQLEKHLSTRKPSVYKNILSRMVNVDVAKRFSADRALEYGFSHMAFKRRAADDLVACSGEYEGDSAGDEKVGDCIVCAPASLYNTDSEATVSR